MEIPRTTLRLDAPERELAERLSQHYGLPDRTALIRYLLRREGKTLRLDRDLPAARVAKRGRPPKKMA